MNEVWKDIKGYEGYYQVSNLGKIKSLKRTVDKFGGKGNKNGYKEKILKQSFNGSGYKKVNLYKDNKYKGFTVHRLVALHFIENDDPINKTEVNHIDENKLNNCVDNLEWCTPDYNKNYGTRIKRSRQTSLENNSYEKNLKKAREKRIKRVKCITTGIEFNSVREAATYYNITDANICACCNGKYKYSGMLPDGTKLKWEYL